MKKFLKIILIILIITLVKLLFSFTTNEILIANYNKEKYNDSLVNALYFINIPESYIAYYNHGNIFYKEGNYEEAINKFETSLEKNPPQKRVCDIRVNLALSITATVDTNNKSTALSKLKKARKVLYENNCADEFGDDGEDEKAEKLEEEIKKLEEELENSEENNNDNNNNQDNNEENDDQKEQSIEEKLKEIQRDSTTSRQQKIESDENNTLTFYDGKSW